MSSLRNIGYKVYLLVKSYENGKDELCKMLNFSDVDYNKLIIGRLAVTPIQIKKIAELFSVQPADIINYKNDDAYSAMVHCMSKFTRQENCDEILNIIDNYIDFAEISNNIK